jgi:hypothetical protein
MYVDEMKDDPAETGRRALLRQLGEVAWKPDCKSEVTAVA